MRKIIVSIIFVSLLIVGFSACKKRALSKMEGVYNGMFIHSTQGSSFTNVEGPFTFVVQVKDKNTITLQFDYDVYDYVVDAKMSGNNFTIVQENIDFGNGQIETIFGDGSFKGDSLLVSWSEFGTMGTNKSAIATHAGRLKKR